MLSLKCPFTDKGEYYMAYLRPSAHKALHPDQLKYVFDSKTLEVKEPPSKTPIETIIGQERALKALRLGIELKSQGYNIFEPEYQEQGNALLVKGF